jgi:hypothetical protein
MKKTILIIVAFLIPITAFGATVPWYRSGTSISPLYIGDKVGIKTQTPLGDFDVYNPLYSRSSLIVDNVNNYVGIGGLSGSGALDEFEGIMVSFPVLPSYPNVDIGSPGYTGNGTRLRVDDYNKLFLFGVGSIGIATATPTAKLDLYGEVANTQDLFRVSSSTGQNWVTIKSSGNVGIGTTSPAEKFDVSGGNIIMSNNTNLKFYDSGGIARNIIGLTSADNVTVAGKAGTTDIGLQGISTFVVKSTGAVGINDSGPDFRFESTGTLGNGYFGLTNSTDGDILTVNSSGNMGIGTTSPIAKLSVKGAGSTTGVNFQTTNSSNSPLFTILDNGNVGIGTTEPGTVGTQTFLTGILNVYNSAIGKIYARGGGYGEIGWEDTGAGTGDKVASLIYDGGKLSFRRINDDFNSIVSTPWVIDSQSNIGIGTTSPIAKLSVMNTLGGSTPLFVVASSTNNLGTTTAFTVAANGRVGIGTTTPTANLEVQSTLTDSATTKLFSISSSTNSQIFTVLGNEKVGIGTNNPQGSLSVRTGGTVAGATIYFDNFTCGSGYAGFSFNGVLPTACGNYNFLSGAGDQTLYINRPSAKGIIFRENNSTQAGFMPTTGNFNLGSTTQFAAVSNKLSVYGATSIGAGYENITAPTNGLIVKGNVGIGTTTVSTALTVVGTTTTTQANITSGVSYGGQSVCYMADGSLGHQTAAQLTAGTCVQN